MNYFLYEYMLAFAISSIFGLKSTLSDAHTAMPACSGFCFLHKLTGLGSITARKVFLGDYIWLVFNLISHSDFFN